MRAYLGLKKVKAVFEMTIYLRQIGLRFFQPFLTYRFEGPDSLFDLFHHIEKKRQANVGWNTPHKMFPNYAKQPSKKMTCSFSA